MPAATVHLKPTASLAERVLLPGDPGRALLLAQTLLREPKMFNHHRGLWGYTGTAPDGELATVQSTGMGGPSAAIVVEELARLGARRIIRVGTCGALDPELALGATVVVTEAIAADGTSRALGAGAGVTADAGLVGAMGVAAGPAATVGRVVSSDLFYDDDPGRVAAWRAAGAAAVEMEAAAVLQVGALRGLRAACILMVSDLLGAGRRRLDDESLAAAAEHIGRIALQAL